MIQSSVAILFARAAFVHPLSVAAHLRTGHPSRFNSTVPVQAFVLRLAVRQDVRSQLNRSPDSFLDSIMLYPAMGAVTGAWVTMATLPLDWDRPWQVSRTVCQANGIGLSIAASNWIYRGLHYRRLYSLGSSIVMYQAQPNVSRHTLVSH